MCIPSPQKIFSLREHPGVAHVVQHFTHACRIHKRFLMWTLVRAPFEMTPVLDSLTNPLPSPLGMFMHTGLSIFSNLYWTK
ncbi:hypothetical protein Y032_0093g2622 [Ancylostoma ceylanicum]|uniref:Uncharacterized protein n=1 Tax=Ancylostoma ceylanicum TaxID=53326 RepID=A0A016TLS3_9BILA|nr:hypothetical protein Y032_0093g2622 [Ancylostoma ceylanicum]